MYVMDAHCLVIHKLNNACQATRVNPSRNLQLIANIFRTLWCNFDPSFSTVHIFNDFSCGCLKLFHIQIILDVF